MRWKTLLYMEASFLSSADCSSFSFFRSALMSLHQSSAELLHSGLAQHNQIWNSSASTCCFLHLLGFTTPGALMAVQLNAAHEHKVGD